MLSWGYVLVQLLNIGLLLGWLGLDLWALWQMRSRTMSDTAKALWTLIVLLLPIVGALAFWIVRPGQEAAVG